MFNKEFSVPWWEALQYFAALSVAPRQGSLSHQEPLQLFSQPNQPYQYQPMDPTYWSLWLPWTGRRRRTWTRMKLQQQQHMFSEVLERKEFENAFGQELFRKWQIISIIKWFWWACRKWKIKWLFHFFVLLDKFKSSPLKIMFLIQWIKPWKSRNSWGGGLRKSTPLRQKKLNLLYILKHPVFLNVSF